MVSGSASFVSVYGLRSDLLRSFGSWIPVHHDHFVGAATVARHRAACEHVIKGCRHLCRVGTIDPDLDVATSADPSDKNDQTGSSDPGLDLCVCRFSHATSKNDQDPRSAWIGGCGQLWRLSTV